MNELKKEVKKLFEKYDTLYEAELINNTDIEKYWENEFYGWKREAFQDILGLMNV